MTRQLLLLATLVTALMTPQPFMAAPKPGGITDLGTLGGDYSDAFGINNDAGTLHVVGQSRTASGIVHGFFWAAPGPMVDLGGLDGCTSHARAVNNHRQVAGGSADAQGNRWAVLWTHGEGGWTIDKLPTLTGLCCADAGAINNGNAGDPLTVSVAGNSTSSSGAGHAVVWTKSPAGWSIEDVGTLPGDEYSTATGLNDYGEIVGISSTAAGPASGFLRTALTGMVRLAGLGGETYALAINNTGDVAGLSTDASGNRHAVRWRAANGWTLEDLGTLGGCCSAGYGINSAGDVVGVSHISQRYTGTQHGFLANSAGMLDLGTLQRNSAARALSDFGFAAGSSSSRGSLHAVIWKLP